MPIVANQLAISACQRTLRGVDADDVEGHESEIVQDRALWDINVPMHISLHPGWIDNKADYYSKIIPFLVHKGIDVSNIEQRGNFFDIQIDV